MKKRIKDLIQKTKELYKKVPIKEKEDFLFGLFLFVITFAFWFPTRDLPYWWDSTYITKSAFKFLETNFSPLIPEGGDFSHPPLFMALLAFLWEVFGESLLVSHLLVLVFTFGTLFYTYLLGKEIVKKKFLGEWIGFFAAFLLLVAPVFLAQVGIVYVEIPVTAFAVAAVYYFLRGNFLGYVVAGSLMLLTKEVSAVIVLTLGGVSLGDEILRSVRAKKMETEKIAKKFSIIFLPFIPLFLWFFYHKMVTGWVLIRPGRNLGGAGGLNFDQVEPAFRFFFLKQGRILLSLIVALMGLGAVYRKDFRKYFEEKKIIIILLIPLVVVFFFGTTEFLYRYILIGLPFFFVGTLYFLVKVLDMIPFIRKEGVALKASLVGFLVLFLFYLSYGSWDRHQRIASWRFTPIEENLEYRDIIKIGQDVASYIEENHADKTIWTSFPTNYMLSDPRQHFVSRKIEVRNCNTYEEGDEVEMVVFHVFSPVSQHCLALVRQLNLSLLTPFARNGKWIQVYQNPNL